MSLATGIEKLIELEREKAREEARNAATSLPESSYGAVQSVVVLYHFTSFLELRRQIKARRWYSYRGPGQVYQGTCDPVHIHHGDGGHKTAILVCSSHWDI